MSNITKQNYAPDFRFTDEEMETAKGTDLPDLLEHLGYTVRRLGSRYHTTREMDSLRIKDRRTWKRYSSGKGRDAIDLMSFCTLHRQVRSNAVALCGLYQGPLDTYLRENPHLKRIVLCLDADEPGQETTEKFRAEYVQRGYDVSTRMPAQGKDWNAYLQQRGQARDRGNQFQNIAR